MIDHIPQRSDLTQRYLYSHDITSPPIISKFFKLADAVMQPENEDDVLKILLYAKERKIPLVARGSATSGYGGAVPFKGGIIVDFSRMDRFEVDEERRILIAEPGAVWWEIEKKLNKLGLSLRVYPTSAPSSTVGGWIGQNGYGIGSLAFGSIAENVEKMRIANFGGISETRDIRYYAGLHGTTGFVVKAWIKVKDYEDLNAYAFHVDVKEAIKIAYARKHYSALYLTRRYIEMKNRVSRDEVPEKDTLVVVTAEKLDGDRELGEEIWNDRFYPLRIRRAGPGIVTSEVLIDAEKLKAYLDSIERFGAGTEVWFLKNGLCSALSFVPVDEREGRNVFKYRFSLKALKEAKKLGGKVYSTGLYFSKESRNFYQNFDELLRFKRNIDPENLLNPGKVFPLGLLPRIMGFLEVLA